MYNYFQKGNNYKKKNPAEFQLVTYRFVANAQTDSTTNLGNNFGGKQLDVYTIILDFIVIFNQKYVTI